MYSVLYERPAETWLKKLAKKDPDLAAKIRFIDKHDEAYQRLRRKK
jgi:hypothetical protein